MEGHRCIHACTTTITIRVTVALWMRYGIPLKKFMAAPRLFWTFQTVGVLQGTCTTFLDHQDDTYGCRRLRQGGSHFLTIANLDQTLAQSDWGLRKVMPAQTPSLLSWLATVANISTCCIFECHTYILKHIFWLTKTTLSWCFLVHIQWKRIPSHHIAMLLLVSIFL